MGFAKSFCTRQGNVFRASRLTIGLPLHWQNPVVRVAGVRALLARSLLRYISILRTVARAVRSSINLMPARQDAVRPVGSGL